jgi:sugar phosphate isomerase/epimerase
VPRLQAGNTSESVRRFATDFRQARASRVKGEISPGGGAKQRADLGRIVKLLRDARYQGSVVLEYEAAEDPRTTVPQYLQQLRKLIG